MHCMHSILLRGHCEGKGPEQDPTGIHSHCAHSNPRIIYATNRSYPATFTAMVTYNSSVPCLHCALGCRCQRRRHALRRRRRDVSFLEDQGRQQRDGFFRGQLRQHTCTGGTGKITNQFCAAERTTFSHGHQIDRAAPHQQSASPGQELGQWSPAYCKPAIAALRGASCANCIAIGVELFIVAHMKAYPQRSSRWRPVHRQS